MSNRRSRREFLKTVGVGLAAAGVPRTSRAAVPVQPNIVLILADDVSPDLYSCYGATESSTPHVDQMAQEGVQFRTAWATALCTPTRSVFLTGRYAYRTGVWSNGLLFPQPDGSRELLKYHHSFGKLMKQAGYATAIAGKWHISASKPESPDGGFNEYCLWEQLNAVAELPGPPTFTGAMENATTTSRYWHPCYIKNHELVPTVADDFGPDICCDFLLDFMERNVAAGTPFLAYWSMVAPHGTREGVTTTPHRGPAGEMGSADATEKKLRFQALNEYIDFLVGRMRQKVTDLGIADNTIFIFTSDNGTAVTAKSRGVERGCRAPYVVSGAGIKQRGETNELTDFSDVLPTLVDFAGSSLPAGYEVDGMSLKPFLTGATDTHRDWIFSNIGGTRLLRTKQYLLEAENAMLGLPEGRLYDCGTNRDGHGYRNITSLPESRPVRESFAAILAGMPPLSADNPNFATSHYKEWLDDHIASK